MDLVYYAYSPVLCMTFESWQLESASCAASFMNSTRNGLVEIGKERENLSTANELKYFSRRP
jgi:hypothetical protein